MANGKVHRCVICGIKPSPIGQYCHKCTQAVEKIKREAKSGRVDRFITYQDNVIGLIPKGNGQFIATVLKRDAAKLPASKTLDLNQYCAGFSRQQIKGLKAKIKSLVGS